MMMRLQRTTVPPNRRLRHKQSRPEAPPPPRSPLWSVSSLCRGSQDTAIERAAQQWRTEQVVLDAAGTRPPPPPEGVEDGRTVLCSLSGRIISARFDDEKLLERHGTPLNQESPLVVARLWLPPGKDPTPPPAAPFMV